MSRNSLRQKWSGIAAIAAALIASAVMLAPMAAQGPGGGFKGGKGKVKNGPVRRKADGKVDISGFWATGGNGFYAAFDLEGRTGVDLELKQPFGPNITDETGGKIPYLPAAKAKKDDLFKNHLAEDPQAHCYSSGTPAKFTPLWFSSSLKRMMRRFSLSRRSMRFEFCTSPENTPIPRSRCSRVIRARIGRATSRREHKEPQRSNLVDMSGNFMIPSIESRSGSLLSTRTRSPTPRKFTILRSIAATGRFHSRWCATRIPTTKRSSTRVSKVSRISNTTPKASVA